MASPQFHVFQFQYHYWGAVAALLDTLKANDAPDATIQAARELLQDLYKKLPFPEMKMGGHDEMDIPGYDGYVRPPDHKYE